MAYADLYFGASRTGKTTQIGVAARWARKAYDKPSRLVTADLGTLDCIKGEIDDGTIQVWNLKHHVHLIETIDKACQGYWPQDVDDPNSLLMSPYVIRYYGKCPKCGDEMSSGKPVTQVPCTKCKTITTFAMKRAVNPDNDTSLFAFIAFEGITSFYDTAMDMLANESAIVTGDKDAPINYQSGDTKFSGNSGGHYGLAQRLVPSWIAKSTGIPGVQSVIWTGLEGRGKAEGSGAPMYGVLIPGGDAAAKLIGKAPAWFRHCLHFETVEKVSPATDGGPAVMDIEYRMYLKPHADPVTKAVFSCGLRIPREYAKSFPAWMEPDVGKLYDKINQLQATNK